MNNSPKILSLPVKQGGGKTYLMPCHLCSALVYCIPKPECNIFEQTLVRLAHLGCTKASDVSKALCLDVSLVEFVQSALVQRGLLEANSLQVTSEGAALVKKESEIPPTLRSVSLLFESVTGTMLPVVFDGGLSTCDVLCYKKSKDGNLTFAKYIAEDREEHFATAFPALVPWEGVKIPSAGDIMQVSQRQKQELRKGTLNSDLPFLRTEAAKHHEIKLVPDSHRLVYLPVHLRMGSGERYLVTDDPFGGGESQELLHLVRRYPQFESYYRSILDVYQEKGHSAESLKVPGFLNRFSETYPELAGKMLEMKNDRHERKIEAAYAALEWGLHGLLGKENRKNAVLQLQGSSVEQRQRLHDVCRQLHLQWPDKSMLDVLPLNRLRDYAASDSPTPEMSISLACNLIVASGDLTHKLRILSQRHPDLLSKLKEFKKVRNVVSHGSSGITNLATRASDWEERVSEFINLLYADYRENGHSDSEIYRRNDRLLRTNAMLHLFDRLSFSQAQYLEDERSIAFHALIEALKEEEVLRFSNAVNALAKAMQHLIYDLCGQIRRQKTGSIYSPLSKEEIASRCYSCSLLPEARLPFALETVSLSRYQAVLIREQNSTLGAVMLALLTLMDESQLQQLADNGWGHALPEMARLCTLRGHGNGYNVSAEEWKQVKDSLFNQKIIKSLLINY